MKAYIVKYALTKGIIEVECEPKDVRDGRLWALLPGSRMRDMFGPSEWMPSKAAALALAEQMRNARIASLRKQIEKLEKRSFVELPE